MERIVFMGTPDFSVPILQALAEKYEVVGVVTQPDRPVGRKKILTPTPVKIAAEELNIPVLQPNKITGSKEMIYIMEQLKPDLIVTAAFGQFLPSALLEAPKHGAINVHASLLPKYRGGAPIHYAVMNGDKETGITIMYMEKRMDAGDILSQRSISIDEEDDTGDLFEKLSVLGKELLIDTLPDILAGTIQPIKQNEEDATYSPNITREQEQIEWTLPALQIKNKIRGLRPFPGAFTYWKGSRFKIWDAVIEKEQTNEQPGTIIDFKNNRIQVACGEKTILTLLEVQPAGKSRMSVENFLLGAGNTIQIGERLGK